MASGIGVQQQNANPNRNRNATPRYANQASNSRNPVAVVASSSNTSGVSTKANGNGSGNGNGEDDPETLRLIAEMLQEDLIEADRYSAFERAQLEEVMSSSINGNSATSSNSTSIPSLQDEEVDPTVLHTIEMLNSNDRKLADALSKDLGASARDHQMAQKLGAENSKLALDAEYARQLQALDETGRHDLDWDHLKNLEGVIGKEQIKEIMRQALGEFAPEDDAPSSSSSRSAFQSGSGAQGKGKGKARADGGHFQSKDSRDVRMSDPSEESQTLCEICADPITICYDPFSESKKGAASSDTSLGMILTPCRHKICHDDLVRHIDIKLEDAKSGQKKAFPMLCPLCPEAKPGQEVQEVINDDMARRILGAGNMARWENQKIMDSLETIYCPRKTCSVVLSLDAFDQAPGAPTDATCPTCNLYFCASCKVPYHRGLTCERYQALPPEERDEDDRAVLDLAKQQNWRRCPQCKAIVELESGCLHMSCLCGKEFCYQCGSDWRKSPNECTREGTRDNPKCPLFNEEMLLEPAERARLRQQAAPQAPAPAQAAQVPQRQAPVLPLYQAPVPPQQRQNAQPAIRGRRAPIPRGPHEVDSAGCHCHNDFYYLTEGPNGVMPHSKVNAFTRDMLRSMQCLYCDVQLYSPQDLAHHLSYAATHRVLSCCHKLYDSEHALRQHQNSPGCGFAGARRGNDYSFLEHGQFNFNLMNNVTRCMANGECYYCRRGFNNPRALSQHLASETHPVYLCCETFFDSSDSKEEHQYYYH